MAAQTALGVQGPQSREDRSTLDGVPARLPLGAHVARLSVESRPARGLVSTIEADDRPADPVVYLDEIDVPSTVDAGAPTTDSQTTAPETRSMSELKAFVSDELLESAGRRPRRRRELVSVQILQAWEGTVVSVDGPAFIARLRDRTDPAHEEEIATFEIEALVDDDQPLVVPGAVFYWSVGYEVHGRGRKKLYSELRFRRLPAWSERDAWRIEHQAGELDDLFTDETDEPSTSSGA